MAAFYGLLPIFDVNPLTIETGWWEGGNVGVIYSLHQCLVYIKHHFSSSGQVLLLYHTVIRGGRRVAGSLIQFA